jgi:predicted metalloprotease with PDZ domain
LAERARSGQKSGGWSLKPVLTTLLLLSASGVFAQTPEPVRYTVSFPEPHTHYVEIEASVPTDAREHVDLMMPVWTPGSYMVREYARHVEGLAAADAARAPLRVDKTRKNRWRVATARSPRVSLRYRVYAHEMSVRTNWVDEEFALLNGAATFITLAESPSRRAHEVRVILPRGWARSFSGMSTGPGEGTYLAPDYDTLVDSPIVAGNPSVYEFRVLDKPHFLVNLRERGTWNGPRAVQDLAKVADAATRFWGGAPFDRYYFFNIIGAPRNGLEHKSSTVIQVPLEAARARGPYVDWLSSASHEYFHAWNVKRLRPVELGPFDYENEVYTKSLWFAEGVTDYYADLLLARAGVISRDEYLELLSAQIRSLQTTPGRLVQSAEMASFDAWIKYYRPDENSANTSISYYVKGAVIAFVLDAKLRRLTGGRRSLDDVMRRMGEQFSGEHGFRGEDVRATVEAVARAEDAQELRGWLSRALETTEELDYSEAVDWFGLRITTATEMPRAWLGVVTRTEDDRTVVSEVRRGSPAYAAGISIGDEITAIDGQRLKTVSLAERLRALRPGTTILLSMSRHDEERMKEIILGTDPGHGWTLSPTRVPTVEQKQHLDSWLGPG